MILRRSLLIAAAVMMLLCGMLTMAGRFVSKPSDTPVKGDLIVALGGDGGSRVREAQLLYAAGYAPRILLTGIEQGDPLVRPAYLEWRAAFLVAHGVPADVMLFDSRSANSWEESRNTLALMQQKGWHSVLVVSDPPHMRRLSWVWRKVFADSGMMFRLIASPMPGWDAELWWHNEKSAQFVLMELIKLGYYLVTY